MNFSKEIPPKRLGNFIKHQNTDLHEPENFYCPNCEKIPHEITYVEIENYGKKCNAMSVKK